MSLLPSPELTPVLCAMISFVLGLVFITLTLGANMVWDSTAEALRPWWLNRRQMAMAAQVGGSYWVCPGRITRSVLPSFPWLPGESDTACPALDSMLRALNADAAPDLPEAAECELSVLPAA